MMKPCGVGVIHPGLGLEGQEYSAMALPKYTSINDHSINLVDNK